MQPRNIRLIIGICLCLFSLSSSTAWAKKTIKLVPSTQKDPPIRGKHLGVRIVKKGDYTESWIVWAWNKQGYEVYALFVITKIFLGTRFGVMLTLRTPDGKLHQHIKDYKKKDLRLKKGTFSLRIGGKHRLVGTPKKATLVIQFKKMGVRLRFKRLLSGFRVQNGPISFGKEQFIGLSYAPRTKVKGTIRVGKKTVPFKGIGFSDHSWQDIMPPKMSRRWYGGRGFNKTYSVLASHLQPAKAWGPELPGLKIAKGNKWIYSGSATQLRYKESRKLKDKVTGYYPPRKVEYWGKMKDGRTFHLKILHKTLSNRLDVLAHFNAILRFLVQRFITKPFLLRYRSTFILTFYKEGKVVERTKLKGRCEWVYINP
ncbi:MAG TPA: hypothetical protein DCE42_13970 [Myxococcales bacterium]|nr:hypothetical protein [Deltaproteobacteria bacterium]HAA55865.1 hypothetical protein [Myxococcales bacterium]|tara:strand:+ start:953 stop:2062 length:1110 start_codon:yes stop_codon:yes gene_type:complete